MRLSRNFTTEEMDCHSGDELPVRLYPNAQHWVDTIGQPLRNDWGQIIIVGPWRTPAWNRRVGGALHSAHMFGEEEDAGPIEEGIAGLDIRPAKVADVPALHAFILSLYQEGRLPGLGGLGLYPRWVHADTRKAPDGHLRRWTGAGVGGERNYGR